MGIKPGTVTRGYCRHLRVTRSGGCKLFHDPSQVPNPATMTDEATRLAGDRIAHAMYAWDPYMHNPKLRYRLHRIDVPTLLLWGASDGVVSVAYGRPIVR